MRVYELARELGVTSREVLEALEGSGLADPPDHASQVLTEEEEAVVRKAFATTSPEVTMAPPSDPGQVPPDYGEEPAPNDGPTTGTWRLVRKASLRHGALVVRRGGTIGADVLRQLPARHRALFDPV